MNCWAPEGGFNTRRRLFKPPSGGLGVSAGMLVFGGTYFESITKTEFINTTMRI
jgi:hypothetical protein